MKIYLVGMPGSGKSTLGKQLAAVLNIPFIDLDEEVERSTGKSVTEIFREDGEPVFRQMESEQLHLFAASSESFVMATGGGAPCFYNGMEIIKRTGISIFLNVPVNELGKRLQADGKRPLLASDENPEIQLKTLFENRIQVYKQATFEIADVSPTLEDVFEKLNIKK